MKTKMVLCKIVRSDGSVVIGLRERTAIVLNGLNAFQYDLTNEDTCTRGHGFISVTELEETSYEAKRTYK